MEEDRQETLRQIFEQLLASKHTGRVLFHFRGGYPVLIEKLPRRPGGRVSVIQPESPSKS